MPNIEETLVRGTPSSSAIALGRKAANFVNVIRPGEPVLKSRHLRVIDTVDFYGNNILHEGRTQYSGLDDTLYINENPSGNISRRKSNTLPVVEAVLENLVWRDNNQQARIILDHANAVLLGTIAVQEDDVDVVNPCGTVDFLGDDFNVTSGPATEANIAINRNVADGIAGLDAAARLAKVQQHLNTVYMDDVQTIGSTGAKKTFSHGVAAGSTAGLRLLSVTGEPAVLDEGDLYNNNGVLRFADNIPTAFTIAQQAATLVAGSVIFADANGRLQQDNANLFWDDTSNFLRVGSGSVGAGALTVRKDDGTTCFFQRNEAGIPQLFDMRNTVPPANGTGVGLSFVGRNQANSDTGFATIQCSVADITTGSEDGKFAVLLAAGGAQQFVYQVDENANFHSWSLDNVEIMRAVTAGLGIGTNTPQELLHVSSATQSSIFQRDGASVTNPVIVRNLQSPVAFGYGGGAQFQMRNNAGAIKTYAAVEGRVYGVAAGTESGEMHLLVIKGGVPQSAYIINEGDEMHRWLLNSVEKMRLNTTGLGVGSTNPITRLHGRQDFSGATSNIVTLENRASAASTGMQLNFDALDSVGGQDTYVALRGTVIDGTSGSEDGRAEVRVLKAGVQGTRVFINGDNLGFNGESYGSGAGVLFVADAATNPSTNPVGGGILYSTGGAGTWRGSGGTVTTFGPAEPHCPRCGADFAMKWENAKYGKLSVCFACMVKRLDPTGELFTINRGDPWIEPLFDLMAA